MEVHKTECPFDLLTLSTPFLATILHRHSPAIVLRLGPPVGQSHGCNLYDFNNHLYDLMGYLLFWDLVSRAKKTYQIGISKKGRHDMSEDDSSLREGASPEVLDKLWQHFNATGGVAMLHQIASVLDWKDIVRLRLQEWLETTTPNCWTEEPYRSYREMLIRCVFPVDYEKRRIGGPADLDLHVALAFRGCDLNFTELPFQLAHHELVRLAMKSAVVWSLKSMAEHNEIVATFCVEASKKAGGAARLLLSKNK